MAAAPQPSKKTPEELNPRTTEYDFFGPIGALTVTVTVPIITYILYFGCAEETGGCPPKFEMQDLVSFFSREGWWKRFWDTEATIAYFGWYAFCVLCWIILPGSWLKGAVLRDGSVKEYKINGFATFMLAIGLAVGSIIKYGPGPMTFIYHKWVGLCTAALLMSIIQAIYVYAMSFVPGKLLALGGNTGNVIYDFFIGRELNPSIGSFDIMSFNELRPGLILWALINISMICEQAVRRGGFANVTDSMWLASAFQIWYVADALYNEPALFTTIDIVTDGFGFMLSVGDLLWVPFTFSLQTRYLVFNQVELGPVNTALIIGVNFFGYWIFRSANGEKNDFRNGKNPKNLKYMPTERGTKLLISGWWGISRHPNYIGDLVMALAWSLPCGFSSLVPYYYPIYFTIFLMHRQSRDDAWCQKKYGKDWDKYKKLVPYKIFPYIY
ncbi:erg24, C-14 sterol reductase [Paramarasmius palmivorus]|uniref:Delta(14)-sterol reductase ERG24 n=1 Tax=Paramarasmius palmivorus TaxID=297713 RepID=A0AAW0CEY8_9AGAR